MHGKSTLTEKREIRVSKRERERERERERGGGVVNM